MKKINILQVKGAMNRGGSEEFLMNILRTIDRSKYSFVFLCFGDDKFDYEEEIKRLGAKIVRIKDVKRSGPLKHISDIRHIIRKEHIDVIHTHTYLNSVFALIAGKKENVHVRIAHSHTSLKGNESGPIKHMYSVVSKKLILKYATQLTACGNEAGMSLFGGTDFMTIRNGIILDDFYFNSSLRKTNRNILGISEGTTVIGHVGRFVEPKNHVFILNIMKDYLMHDKDAVLMLVGDGPLRTAIESAATMMKIHKKILWLGTRDDVPKLYNTMDMLLFPSLWEGLPLTLVEAQVNSLPCLISDVIDPDVKLTTSLQRMSLSKSSKEWAAKLLSLKSTRTRNKMIKDNNKYDILISAQELARLYSATKPTEETP